ncbi:hypothetical protein HPA02_08180 [Bisbaumannia pacifica]|uniref:Uncharacterized protein n=1 Tax=Bisbaumannia pacifica TaxID=77098 RepID=A0A510X7U4_9GAMM|nr:hypothetical protein HPA02_08180 [Halomonas pacifica]
MLYGVKPEGMTAADWTVECQCRHVAREMRRGRNSTERGAIFDRWQKQLPAVTRARVGEIWREGVPMPGNGRGNG